ncbi:FmdB family zinc ribbon protein [Deinococcus peraridilitoris]|uniref:Regulatory protein, FmdB family n=1 Tax=Deinococcus peraridilitoris (strain DSM 19664 / LMG 22246 / CIP 109416 / KR-200) TaxID=937777 RepID=L0A4S3_DEIPD|nr:hypothetical protein [Deinococcus peraridilitoris]AFZ68162.1 hypothetical protein Deipe_2697 [Deinococcus peraridilitoris DSM 19664]
MPTYLYKGLESGEIYEIKQSMKDAALESHPETGEKIKRVLARPGIAFRGSGFYVTDNRPKESTGAASSD